MKQIYLDNHNSNDLIGRRIKGVSYLNYEDPQLILTFDDDTFIYVELDLENETFRDGSVTPLRCYSSLPGYIDSDGNVHLEKYIQEQIVLGVVEMDEETIEYLKIEKLNAVKKKEEQEYQKYLELKKKFEHE